MNITQFPLPVIVGIGHERDTTVLDFVAYKSVKTPTAVAEFLISAITNSDTYLNELSGEIVDRINLILSEERLKLSTAESVIPSLITNKIERERNRLSQLQNRVVMGINSKVGKEEIKLATTYTTLKNRFEQNIEREQNRIANIATNIELLSPDKILKRGYSISVKDGYPVKSVSDIKESDNIRVIFADGEAEAEIKCLKNL